MAVGRCCHLAAWKVMGYNENGLLWTKPSGDGIKSLDAYVK